MTRSPQSPGASTYLDHIDPSPGGRFAELARRERDAKPAVIGLDPAAQYPRQPGDSPWAGDAVGVEPPLGYSIQDMEPVGEAHEIEASLAALPEAPLDGCSSSIVETGNAANPALPEALIGAHPDVAARLAEILPRIVRPATMRRRKL
jgi:hypothetical protein